jgi:Na+/proline symporter
MAAIMSSASGYLISASSSLVQDVYHRILRPNADQKELLRASRGVTLGIGLVALGLALGTDPDDKNSAVYYLVLWAWGGLAGSFSAPILMAIYYRRMTRAGCLAGIVSGAVASVVWHNIPALASVAYEVIPSIGISACAIWSVSQVTGTAEEGQKIASND